MPREGLARLRVPRILEIVVTDRELSIRFLDIRVIDDTDVAATENRAFVWVAGDGALGQV